MEQASTFAKNYAASGGKGRFEDYYSTAYDRVLVQEVLRKHIVFFQHNLVSDYALGEMHVIFCRNVLIYFGQPLRERVLRMFSEGLCRGGFLCLGSSESLPAAVSGLYTTFAQPERVYRHKGRT
jgi:chemotaxis protein methyltransferase CheR